MKEIRRIIDYYDKVDHENEQLALASVVNVEQSSYRRIGARMLVSSNGQWIGGISGGCLEGDALRRSQKAIYSKKASVLIYDTRDEDDNQIGIGLGCNGKIEVLVVPIDPHNMNNPIELLRKAVENDKPQIIIKVINEVGTDENLGYSQLIDLESSNFSFLNLNNKELISSIGETKIKRRPQIIELKNQYQKNIKLLIEYLRPEMKLVLIGDNYDVNAFVGIANELGWDIYVVGKKKKLSKSVFDISKAVFDYDAFDDVPVDSYTAVVLMTHDFNKDKSLLPSIISLNPNYIGILGPKKRFHKLEEDLSMGQLEELKSIYSPVGLDIGAESPEEIALSIASEIITVFRQRKGGFLKNRKGTIHEQI